MRKIATALQAAGCAGVAGGLFMVAPWLGVAVGGALTVVFGVAVERSLRREETEHVG